MVLELIIKLKRIKSWRDFNMPVLKDKKKISKPRKTPETPVQYRRMEAIKKTKRLRKVPES